MLEVCAKVSLVLGFLKFAKRLLLKGTFSQVYRGIIKPYFHFCSSVWGSCGETRLLTFQKLQNRASRKVTSKAVMCLLMPCFIS